MVSRVITNNNDEMVVDDDSSNCNGKDSGLIDRFLAYRRHRAL
jgi:hypothetical protein